MKRFKILVFCMLLTSCIHLNNQYSDDSVVYFKLLTVNNDSKQIAAEFWQDKPGYTYLYADLLLESIRTEVVQFVFFNSDYTVNHTQHYLLYNKSLAISGGVSVGQDSIVVDDTFHGKEQAIELPFKGIILHPTKLAEYLQAHQNISENQLFGFVDWRARPPTIDQFNIYDLKNGNYIFKTKRKNSIYVYIESNRIKKISLRFDKNDKNPDSDLTIISREEFDKRSISKFDETQDYLKYLKPGL